MTSGEEKPPTQAGAILMGTGLVVTGLFVLSEALFPNIVTFNVPRWVGACVGGASSVAGAWLLTLCALGYDPRRPAELRPPRMLQALFFAATMLLFAAPFHWIAFGPGPREFTSSLSVPFLGTRHSKTDLPGRIAFGLGALGMDAILILGIRSFLRRDEPGQSVSGGRSS